MRRFPKNLHIKEKYLAIIENVTDKEAAGKGDILAHDEEQKKWKDLNISPSIFIGCTSRSILKRYAYKSLKEVVDYLGKHYPVVILGEEADRDFYKDVLTLEGVRDLTGKTNMREVFYLLKHYARALLAVDVDVFLGIVVFIILRAGSEKVFLAAHLAACACRRISGAVGCLLIGVRAYVLRRISPAFGWIGP